MVPTDVGYRDVCMNKWFWVECIVCIVHCPPLITTEIALPPSMNNIAVYRIETLCCAVCMARLYLIWRAFADYMLQDLPSKDSIASYTGISFDSKFVIKRMLNSWMAMFWIASFYLVVVAVGGYLYRMAEHTHSCLFEVDFVYRFPAKGAESAVFWN